MVSPLPIESQPEITTLSQQVITFPKNDSLNRGPADLYVGYYRNHSMHTGEHQMYLLMRLVIQSQNCPRNDIVILQSDTLLLTLLSKILYLGHNRQVGSPNCRPNCSDKPWVRSVLTKNFRTSNIFRTSNMVNRLKNTEPDYNDLRLFITKF